MKPATLLFCIAIASPLLSFTQAQSVPKNDSLTTFFAASYFSGEALPVWQLTTDWNGLIRKKMEMKYQPATLSCPGLDGGRIELNVEIKARGNMRKQVCHYPPLKIKVPKKQLAPLGFHPSANELKMVLQCRSGGQEEDWLLSEWLIYQLYELLSPVALRARLIRLQGLQNGKDTMSLYAFLLEDEEEMAVRLGAKVAQQGVIRISILERESYVRMCFFQYMIANTDWSIPNRHNIEFVQAPAYPGVITVPYDFDYAGLVGTNYAVPHESLPIKSVGERYFQGHQVTEAEALRARNYFLERKEDIMQKCRALSELHEKAKKPLLRFMDEFFYAIEDEKRMKRIFVTAGR